MVESRVDGPNIEARLLSEGSAEAVADRLPFAQKTSRQDVATWVLRAVLNQHDQGITVEAEQRDIDGHVGAGVLVESSHLISLFDLCDNRLFDICDNWVISVLR